MHDLATAHFDRDLPALHRNPHDGLDDNGAEHSDIVAMDGLGPGPPPSSCRREVQDGTLSEATLPISAGRCILIGGLSRVDVPHSPGGSAAFSNDGVVNECHPTLCRRHLKRPTGAHLPRDARARSRCRPRHEGSIRRPRSRLCKTCPRARRGTRPTITTRG